MGGYTLGLDLGPNSIGWALVEEAVGGGKGRLVDCGVRVFPEGVDAFGTGKESSRNEQRRIARMMRRQIRRRSLRRKTVAAALVEAELLPADDAERAKVLSRDPYPLRDRAVRENETLEPFEIGRVFYHLNQRRGFLSLKKVSQRKIEKELKAMEKKKATTAASAITAGDGEVKKEDDSKMLAAIELLAQRIGTRTLGQTLFEEQSNVTSRTSNGLPIPVRIRDQHTRRSMLEDEFLRIWDYQKRYYPKLLTDAACFGANGKQDAQRTQAAISRDHSRTLLQQFGLHGLIFRQRPVYWPREMIGMCELEKGQRRCPRADRRAQRFRMLQEINNLRYTPSGVFDERQLDDQQRSVLLKKVYTVEKVTFDQIRDLLGLPGVKFNLERGERCSIKGCETDVRLAKECKQWQKLDEATKDGIVGLLIDAERDVAAAQEKLVGQFNLAHDEADALLSVDLPKGYLRFSLKAIDKLLPHLERGLILMGKSDAEASAMHSAGYLRRDELQRRLFEKLPSLETIHSGPLADLPNPVVKATMHELRRVVNAIVREYGPPGAVHVEMARSLKMSSEKRKDYNKKIHDRGEETDRIRALLREHKIVPTKDAILKYRLWQEQEERCIYTNRSIGFAQLYNGDTDIDHILPYSLTLDDSQMNKVVCFRDANHEKKQQSPFQWLGGSDPQRLKQIEQWAECLPFAKRRKIVQQEIKSDDFIARQLVDTAYIARLAVTYLEMLVQNKHDVQGRKGTYTANLRHHWGLGDSLESLPDSPAWQEKNYLSPGEKNRADHRHHALDAIINALTNRKTLAAMHQGKETVNHIDKKTGEVVEYQRFTKDIPPPWGMEPEEFRQMVMEKLKAVNVSHRVRRGVGGRLHEETNYGPVHDPSNGERKNGVFVVRKPVESLTMNEVASIRDKVIRELVVARLTGNGINPGRGAEKVTPKKMQEVMVGLVMPSGVPIRKVRVLREDSTIRSVRPGAFVKPGKNHHVCIFEWTEKGKLRREGLFVTRLEAAERLKNHEPLIRRTHGGRPDGRFLMSLCPGDTVLIKEKSGIEHLMVITTLVAGEVQQRIHAVSIYDARRSGDRSNPSVTGKLTAIRKVTVDPLGRIRWAND